MRADDGVVMYIKLAAIVTVSIIVIVSCGGIVMAEANHHTDLTATVCQRTVTEYEVNGTAISWKSDGTGANSNVIIEQSTLHSNNSVTSGYVMTGAFSAANNYQFGFKFTVPSTAITITVRSTAGIWSDGANGGQVNTAYATFIGVCPADPTPKVTPEPPTATPTKTATNTVTPTPTKTATATVTPTPTQVWDKSSVTVVVKCLSGYTVFLTTNTGSSMTGVTAWTLYLNDVPVRDGWYQIAAGETKTQSFAPGEYDGVLKLVVGQRPGHPGTGLAQASMTSDDCVNSPTGIEEQPEPVRLNLVRTDYADAEGNVFFVYEISCGSYAGDIDVEFTFSDGGTQYASNLANCYDLLYVPANTKIVILYDTAGVQIASAKPAVEISDPPSILSSVYLPLVTK